MSPPCAGARYSCRRSRRTTAARDGTALLWI